MGCGRSKVRATSRALGKVDDRQRANGIDVLSYRYGFPYLKVAIQKESIYGVQIFVAYG